MEYLSFRHARQHYAVTINSVRFITADSSLRITRVASGQGKQHDMVEFEGEPCVVLSLAELLGQHSALHQVDELTTLLRAREQDHIDWLDALEQSLRHGNEFSKARDPHQCAFGRWYDNFRSDNSALAQLLQKFDAPHRRIHALADELLQLRDQGQTEQALEILNEQKRTTLVRLQELFSDAIGMISASVRPTVIMLQDQQNSVVGLRVDDIGEVFSCDALQHDQGAHELLPEFATSWLKDVDLSSGKQTVMLLNPDQLVQYQLQPA
ncbi:CZB domain-containing protein [Bacterioplanoides pacificum]|uniref:CZB domain-containing protein n=1 Tax=Bacterioplanoides pacificum TaxID=1171596 RepID=A0ABV7VVC1_9GAMM